MSEDDSFVHGLHSLCLDESSPKPTCTFTRCLPRDEIRVYLLCMGV